jgi:hypothetical protein
MRKKPGRLREEDLTRLEPDEPREILALQHLVEQYRDETAHFRQLLDEQSQAAYAEQLAAQDRQLAEIKSSASWRLTAPLRQAKQLLRRRAGH